MLLAAQHTQLVAELEAKLTSTDTASEKYEVKFSEASKTVRDVTWRVKGCSALRCVIGCWSGDASVRLHPPSTRLVVLSTLLVVPIVAWYAGASCLVGCPGHFWRLCVGACVCVIPPQLSALKGGIQSLFQRIGCNEK